MKEIVTWIVATKSRVLAAGTALLLLVIYVDWVTGPQIGMGCFYFLIIYIFTLYINKYAGLAVVLVYCVVWLLIKLAAPATPPWELLAWNTAVRLVTFGSIVWLVQISRNLTDEVARLAAAKTAGLQRELALEQQSAQALHQLAGQLEAAGEAARRQFGQEVHDTIGQSLVVLQLQLDMIVKDLPTPLQDRLHAAVAQVQTLLQQTRTLIFEMHPSMLEDLGLEPTLRRYAQYLEAQTDVKVTVTGPGTALAGTPAQRIFLFRAIKELVTNAIKHGKAREIMIGLHPSAGSLRVVVDDDGCGFTPATDAPSATSTGLGFAWISERLRAFGGTWHIESTPQQGARIMLDLPVPDHQSIATSCPAAAAR